MRYLDLVTGSQLVVNMSKSIMFAFTSFSQNPSVCFRRDIEIFKYGEAGHRVPNSPTADPTVSSTQRILE